MENALGSKMDSGPVGVDLNLSTGSNPPTALLALHRIGPYHHARFQEAASVVRLHILETRPASREYPWNFDASGAYVNHRLRDHPHPESDPPVPSVDRQVEALLDSINPQVVVTVGWADSVYHRLLLHAQRRRIPLLLVSDSRRCDEPRHFAKEFLKRQLLRCYGSALVAGTQSRGYLEWLGFPTDAIFQPWDVVDNSAFVRGVCEDPVSEHTVQPHFLCVSRFVGKKNHLALIAAYADYQLQGGRWGLHLIGSGPMQHMIEAAIAELPDSGRVRLDPFQQLDTLITSYGQASAFVLASTTDQWGLVVNEAMAAGLLCLVSSACGCANDLIVHGRTGWVFDPGNSKELAELFHLTETQRPGDRAAMVFAARQILEGFNPQAFAKGLGKALEWAIAHPRFSHRAALTAQLLSIRP